MFDVIIDNGNYCDSIGEYESEQAAKYAGEDWLMFDQIHFLDELTEAQRKNIHSRCTVNNEKWEDVLDDYGYDGSFEVVELPGKSKEEEVRDCEIAYYREHWKL